MSQRGSEAMSDDRKSRPTSANGHSFSKTWAVGSSISHPPTHSPPSSLNSSAKVPMHAKVE
jgi:hypothetical protein